MNGGTIEARRRRGRESQEPFPRPLAICHPDTDHDEQKNHDLSSARFFKQSQNLKLAGEKVEVDFFLPKTSHPAPLVVVAHGFSRSRKNFEGWGQRLARAGY